ncbi:type IV pilus secretin PilQ [Aquabacterium sp. J223]|uniref:type IV pilus secretin PilQ n=1 Tax=Aquabacterium sp. J223 TaxID=2898431 RepID=UPI0021ADE7B1|nr:type IV pilus secretin PilQ [Aquabacterium sp. J223]UUX96538.1 type IV pilus secretin PilQ [Aquabacterium sp. J223]
MRNWRSAVFAMLVGLALPGSGWAQAMIQSITSQQQGGSELLRIELSEPLAAVPAGFATQAPPRIALDLPNVASALGRPNVELNQGNLRSVSVAQAGERTRLVLNLKQAATYTTRLEGKTLLVVLTSPTVAASTGTPAEHFAPSLNQDPQALRDVDFRRGNDGAGRVMVSLPSNQIGVDIRQQGQTLVVEFLRTSVPEPMRRRLDVTDFGTPVQTITTTQSGDRVRMVIQPRGNWEHSAYQSDNQFVVEVRPLAVDPNKLVQGPGFSGEKLSLNFQNIEVRALLQVIADFTNFNVVTSDTVTGNVTLRLKDVPWDQALDIILQAKGLGVRKTGNVLWIAPKDELLAKEQVELEAKKKISDLEPVRTQAFQLNYTKAQDVANGLLGRVAGAPGGGAAVAAPLPGVTGAQSSVTRILSPRGSVFFEARTNQLFVSDIPSKLEEVQALITRIDIPVRQVLIEARIVEADDTFGRSLGARLGAADNRGLQGGIPGYNIGGSNYVTIGGNYSAVGYQTGQSPQVDFTNTQFVNLPANAGALGAANAANFAISLFSPTANRFLNLELSALEAEGRGKIVSSPRVITANQIKALIEQGEELPYQAGTSSGATQIQFRKANLKLEVVPQITPEGNLILDVDVNKDSVGRVTNAGFAINTKHVQTQVLVENGGTVVIGGIFTVTERNDVNKVPLLGDVPVVGNLFKNTTRQQNKTELLIFITPKVVTDNRSTAALR